MISFVKCATLFFIWVSIPLQLYAIKSSVESNTIIHLLLWNNDQVNTHIYKLNSRRVGSDIFSNCRHKNCYLTDNKDFFGIGKVEKFDGILFNGRTLTMNTTADQLPKKRANHQKYVYVCAEPICNISFYRKPNTCNPVLNGYFNMTGSRYSRISGYEIDFSDENKDFLRNAKHQGSGSTDTSICENKLPLNETLLLRNKKKAVAWLVEIHPQDPYFKNGSLVGACRPNEYITNVSKALTAYGQTLDIYNCGYLKYDYEYGPYKLYDEYFFYFDFDHSVDAESISCPLAGLANNSIPIFYGKFNSRYLPLGTYIDAENYTPETLAAQIVYYINQPERYADFFRFRNRSIPYYPINADTYPCKICRAFNTPYYMETDHTCYHKNDAWFPDFANLCTDKYKNDYIG